MKKNPRLKQFKRVNLGKIVFCLEEKLTMSWIEGYFVSQDLYGALLNNDSLKKSSK